MKITAKQKDFSEEIEIPEGVEAGIEGKVVALRKGGKELRRKVHQDVKIEIDGGKIRVSIEESGKNEKKKFGATVGHIKNMIQGLQEGYEYELEICNVHFPMTVEVDKAKRVIVIKNMLGEKCNRIVNFSENVEVEVRAPKIRIKSFDKELAGQTAANLEKLTKIRNRDRNKFQDGIFITKKPGKEFS